MQFDVQKMESSGGVIVKVESDNLDAGNVTVFKDKLDSIISENELVLIDMSKLNFVDSSGLGALLSCLRTINNKNGQLKLFGMAKPVQALFELVRMQRLFSIYNTQDEAIASL